VNRKIEWRIGKGAGEETVPVVPAIGVLDTSTFRGTAPQTGLIEHNQSDGYGKKQR
jgi:hypothetical protein